MSQLPQSKTWLIGNHVRQYLQATGTSMDLFSEAVVRSYHALTPEHQRDIEFSTLPDAYLRRRRDAEKCRRFLSTDEPGRLPADLDDAVVLALPEPYRSYCLETLCARIGVLPVPIPTGVGTIADTQVLSTLLHRVGDVTAAMAPMLDDGRLCEDDWPHMSGALEEIRRLQTTLLGLEQRIRQAVGGEASTVQPMRRGGR